MADLEQLLKAQGLRCAIRQIAWQKCTPTKRTDYESHFLQYLCIDHDHETGVVRGLLCNACNTAIGLFAEDQNRLQFAAIYIAKFSGAS